MARFSGEQSEWHTFDSEEYVARDTVVNDGVVNLAGADSGSAIEAACMNDLFIMVASIILVMLLEFVFPCAVLFKCRV